QTAIARAQPLLPYASDEERALIAAVALRYAGTYDQRLADEQRYRAAMETIVEQYPNDDDAAMLLAEALMETGIHWNADGTPLGANSTEIITLVNRVLARNPAHIMANHLCIHAYDMAPDRTPAVACAQRLDAMTLDPNDEHLAHMPAHTWIE